MRITRVASTVLAVPVVLALTACSGGATGAAAPSAPGPALSPLTAVDADPDGEVLVAAVEHALGAGIEYVRDIESPEKGRVEIASNLTRPEKDEPQDDELQAVAVCEVAAGVEGVTYVSVTEADGSFWVLYGHPSVPAGECTAI